MKHHGRCVCIIGSNLLQNELLAALIEERTGAACRLYGDVGELARDDPRDGAPALLLFDLSDLADARLSVASALARGDIPVYFNVGDDASIEEKALGLGVQGFLYRHDGTATLLRALDVLFAGEIWASRRVMNVCLMSWRLPQPGERTFECGLTRREGEILRLLASGKSNRGIAETFCISPHTVKTHLYNIFRKIKVNNRLEAAQWAGRHLHSSFGLPH